MLRNYQIASTMQNPLKICPHSMSRILFFSNRNSFEDGDLNDDGSNTAQTGDIQTREKTRAEASTNERFKYTTARVGGRRKKSTSKRENDRRVDKNDGNSFIRYGSLIIGGVFLLKLISGLLFGGSNVVYYESSVYQSTTRSIDGNFETTRKESFRTNIPGLTRSEEDIDRSIRLEQARTEREINRFFKDFLIDDE